VIDDVEELGPALERAQGLQPQFEDAQRKLAAKSHDVAKEPASERQASAILDFARKP
jgi:hypothetical protein